jgi:hypothetical protein
VLECRFPLMSRMALLNLKELCTPLISRSFR